MQPYNSSSNIQKCFVSNKPSLITFQQCLNKLHRLLTNVFQDSTVSWAKMSNLRTFDIIQNK